MALTYAFNRQRFLQILAEQGHFMSAHLLTFARDVFRKSQMVQDTFNLTHADEDKLQAMITRETKRLHRLAHQFPFEQHLLNLQALMVSVLLDLKLKMANPQTSINDLRRTLSRIVVLSQEITQQAAKATLRNKEELKRPNPFSLVYKLVQEVVRPRKSEEENERVYMPKLTPG